LSALRNRLAVEAIAVGFGDTHEQRTQRVATLGGGDPAIAGANDGDRTNGQITMA
jgi:hypothetical protein